LPERSAGSIAVFYTGVLLLGFGTGLSTVSNLGIMLDMTVAGSVGLFIGRGVWRALSRAWLARAGGVLRDLITRLTQNPLSGYVAVFAIEAGLISPPCSC